MKSYRFDLRGSKLELPEPTVEAFEEFWKTCFLAIILGDKMKDLMIADLKILIETKTYEEVEE